MVGRVGDGPEGTEEGSGATAATAVKAVTSQTETIIWLISVSAAGRSSSVVAFLLAVRSLSCDIELHKGMIRDDHHDPKTGRRLLL